jgi:hypothetical protein
MGRNNEALSSSEFVTVSASHGAACSLSIVIAFFEFFEPLELKSSLRKPPLSPLLRVLS